MSEQKLAKFSLTAPSRAINHILAPEVYDEISDSHFIAHDDELVRCDLQPLFDEDMVDLLYSRDAWIYLAFEAGICSRRRFIQLEGINFRQIDAHLISGALAMLAIGVFYSLVAFLYAVRLRPIRRSLGAWPRAAAILGGFLLSGLLLLNQRTDLPVAAQVAASLLVLAGNGFAVYVLANLGRSFSILPESRKLVITGPYRVVRASAVSRGGRGDAGMLIQFISPLAALLVAVQMIFQLVRIHYEEDILRQTFPEYKLYSQHTRQLIPMIYLTDTSSIPARFGLRTIGRQFYLQKIRMLVCHSLMIETFPSPPSSRSAPPRNSTYRFAPSAEAPIKILPSFRSTPRNPLEFHVSDEGIQEKSKQALRGAN